MRVLYADARFAKAGGRVVKNVAGYDLMKLHHGALGALGIVVVATLRLRPLPAADLVAWAAVDAPGSLDSIAGLADLLAAPGFQPCGVHFVGPLAPDRIAGDVVVRFQGARAAVLDQFLRVSTHELSQRLGGWRRDLFERTESFPRPKILQTLEQACSRGEEPAAIHLSLHWRPSRTKELLAALARFGTGQLALELARGRGFLTLTAEGARGEVSEPIAAKLREFQGDLSKAGAAACVAAGPRSARALLPALSSDGEPGAGAAKLLAALRRELDPEGRLNRGRLGPLGDAARA
jgi:glycolate oxidase FAD binding subunit